MNPSDPNQITIADIGQFLDALKSRLGFTFHTASPNRNGVVYGRRIPTHNPTIDALMSKNLLKNLPKELTHPSPVSMSVHAMPRDDGRRSKVFKLQCDGIEMVMPLPPGEYVEQPAEWQGSEPHPKAKYYDPLSFGTASYEPDMISHIDVLDAAGNRVDVKAVRRGMTVCRAAEDLAVFSEIGLLSGIVPESIVVVKSIGECRLSETEVEQMREAFEHLLPEDKAESVFDLFKKTKHLNWDVEDLTPPAAHDVLGEEDK